MTTKQLTHCFADPLRSNRMLSPSEEAVIQTSYWETDSSISRLDVQIKDLQLRRQMLATLLSPVRRLAPELLGEIFRHCLPRDYYENGTYKAVMLPSHVCKHWRDVALSTPALWTNIVLCVTNETFESRAALVTTWFSRSGSLPLSFTLEGRENVRPIMAFLLQHCNRWQYINLYVPSEMVRSLEVAEGHLHRLETVRIHAVDITPYSIEHIFGSAPKLRELSLSRRLIWNGLSSSWAQLAELDLGWTGYTVGDCLTLLESMRNLQKLSIYMDTGVVEHRRFIFSHLLVSLHFRGSTAHQLFGHITLPNLRELSVDMIGPEPRSPFISFLKRSSRIQIFSFGIPEMDDDRWNNYTIQIMQHISSLHSLCLVYERCDVHTSSLLERLSPRILDGGQVECLIPKLNTISIRLSCQLYTPEP